MTRHSAPFRPFAVIGLLFLVLGPGMTAPSAAFELFGFRFFGSDEAVDETEGLIDPKRYELDFVVEDDAVEDSVRGASQLWLGRERPVAGNAGLLTRAKADYRRITAALYNAGHYGGSVSITIGGRQAADLRPDARFAEVPRIAVRVVPGPAYTFGAVTIENQAPVPLDEDDLVETMQEIGLSPGGPARAGIVRRGRALLLAAWREQGHPKPMIATQKVTANHAERSLAVRLRVEPGRPATFGAVSVEGAERMDPEFLARQTGIPEGEPFDPDDLKKARQRLNRLDVLSTLKIEEADAIGADGRLPVTVIVRERKRRRVGAGASVSSVDGAGVQAFWMHRNLFGKAERLRIEGEVAGLGQSIEADEFDYRFQAAFTRPGLWHPDFDLTARLTGLREFNDTFEQTTIEGAAEGTFFWSDTLTLKAGPSVKFGEYDDAFGVRDLKTIGFTGSAVYDVRDDKLDARKGFFIAADAFPFHELEFGNSGVRFDLEGRTYFSFGPEERLTLAARTRLGSLLGPPRRETASDLLYFTGGGGSVRGYGFKTIGVTEADRTVTGGRSLLEGSLEARFRATDTIGGVVFADAGTVGSSSLVDFSDDVSIGVGAGLRYFTGIGALRLDVAVPLDRGPDDPPVAIYAGIGQSF